MSMQKTISEARMHASGYRWMTLILVATSVVAIGCRGSRPFGRFVQVSQEPELGLPEVEAPEQRLATTKPRQDSRGLVSNLLERRGQSQMTDSGSDPASVTDSAASQARSSSRRSKPSSDLDSGDLDVVQLSDQSTGQASDEVRTRLAGSRTSSSRRPREATKTPSDIKANSDQSSSDEVAELDNMSAEHRDLLRRQLAATRNSGRTSRPSATTQPNSVDSAIARSALNPPDLPEAKNVPPDDPPTRIASSKASAASTSDKQVNARTQATEAAVSDVTTDTTQRKLAASRSLSDQGPQEHSMSDLVDTEVESAVVQTISDSSDEKGAVQRVSAVRSGAGDSSVSRASIHPGGAPPAAPQTKDPQAKDFAELSENDLLDSILERFSSAPPGESEAERSSRILKQRLVHILAGNPDAAVDRIEGVPDNEQEFLRHQMLGLWTMIDPSGHPVPSRRFNAALPEIREAAKFAAAATDTLEVRSLAFCTEIQSYGQIKPFEGNRFKAGQQVILYCEIENFTATKTEGGFETHLQGSYDVYGADNEKVVSQLLPADRQISANYLRDYFIAYQMHLPQELSPGTYRLQLTMEDVSGKKYGQANIPLEIAK